MSSNIHRFILKFDGTGFPEGEVRADVIKFMKANVGKRGTDWCISKPKLHVIVATSSSGGAALIRLRYAAEIISYDEIKMQFPT